MVDEPLIPETIAARAHEIATALRRDGLPFLNLPVGTDLSLAILDQAVQAVGWRKQLANVQRKFDRIHLDAQRQQRAHVRLKRALRQKVRDFEAMRSAVLDGYAAAGPAMTTLGEIVRRSTALGLPETAWWRKGKRPARAISGQTPLADLLGMTQDELDRAHGRLLEMTQAELDAAWSQRIHENQERARQNAMNQAAKSLLDYTFQTVDPEVIRERMRRVLGRVDASRPTVIVSSREALFVHPWSRSPDWVKDGDPIQSNGVIYQQPHEFRFMHGRRLCITAAGTVTVCACGVFAFEHHFGQTGAASAELSQIGQSPRPGCV